MKNTGKFIKKPIVVYARPVKRKTYVWEKGVMLPVLRGEWILYIKDKERKKKYAVPDKDFRATYDQVDEKAKEMFSK